MTQPIPQRPRNSGISCARLTPIKWRFSRENPICGCSAPSHTSSIPGRKLTGMERLPTKPLFVLRRNFGGGTSFLPPIPAELGKDIFNLVGDKTIVPS